MQAQSARSCFGTRSTAQRLYVQKTPPWTSHSHDSLPKLCAIEQQSSHAFCTSHASAIQMMPVVETSASFSTIAALFTIPIVILILCIWLAVSCSERCGRSDNLPPSQQMSHENSLTVTRASICNAPHVTFRKRKQKGCHDSLQLSRIKRLSTEESETVADSITRVLCDELRFADNTTDVVSHPAINAGHAVKLLNDFFAAAASLPLRHQ
jgi:hypothetical protein